MLYERLFCHAKPKPNALIFEMEARKCKTVKNCHSVSAFGSLLITQQLKILASALAIQKKEKQSADESLMIKKSWGTAS